MGIQEDASAPAAVTSSTGSVTSASFTPVDSSLLLAVVNVGNNTGGTSPTGSVTDSLGSTWSLLRRANTGNSNSGSAEVWALDAGAGLGARTVTVTSSLSGTNGVGVSLCVKVLTGAQPVASQPGATAVQVNGTPFSLVITSTTAGSLLCGALADIVTAASLSVNGSTTAWQTVADGPNTEAYGAFRATNLVTTPGAITLGYTNTAGDNQSIAIVEILAAPAVAPVAIPPPVPPGLQSPMAIPFWPWPIPFAANPVSGTTQSPANIQLPRRYPARATWAGFVSRTANLQPGNQPGGLVRRRYPARAVWAGTVSRTANLQPGNQPGGLVRSRAPARAVWAGFVSTTVNLQATPVSAAQQLIPPGLQSPMAIPFWPWPGPAAAPAPPAGNPQPAATIQLPRRSAARAVWAGTVSRTTNLQPGNQPGMGLVRSRSAARAIWRGFISSTVNLQPGNQPGGLVQRRSTARAVWAGFVSSTFDVLPAPAPVTVMLVPPGMQSPMAFPGYLGTPTTPKPPSPVDISVLAGVSQGDGKGVLAAKGDGKTALPSKADGKGVLLVQGDGKTILPSVWQRGR